MEEDETEHLMKGENGKILKESISQLKTSEMEEHEIKQLGINNTTFCVNQKPLVLNDGNQELFSFTDKGVIRAKGEVTKDPKKIGEAILEFVKSQTTNSN